MFFSNVGTLRGIKAISPISKGGEEIRLAGYIILELLSSGGSGLRNRSLHILVAIREAKKLQVQKLNTEKLQE